MGVKGDQATAMIDHNRIAPSRAEPSRMDDEPGSRRLDCGTGSGCDVHTGMQLPDVQDRVKSITER